MARVFGNIDLAEDAVQDAFVEATRRWPTAGIPENPAGWITTTARRRGLDRIRRDAKRADRQKRVAEHDVGSGAMGPVADDLCREGIRLTRLLLNLMPDEVEVRGLLPCCC